MHHHSKSPTQLINHLHQILRTQNLLPPSTRPLLAVSGGQDSLTLAESLHLLNQKHNYWPGLTLVHCDHRWPGDHPISHHVSTYANSRHLPLHIIRADPPPAQTEAAAREWRYSQLATFAKRAGFHAVVTGHTMTDAAETILHAMCKGWASALGGIKWKRCLVDHVSLVRPLLTVSRCDTERFCKERGLKVWKDVYNEDVKYARNRIRMRVVPVLEQELNSKVEHALCRVGRVVADDAEFVQNVADDVYDTAVAIVDGDVRVDATRLLREHVAVQRRVMKRVLMEEGRQVGFEFIEKVRTLLHGGKMHWSEGGAVCENGVLVVWRKKLSHKDVKEKKETAQLGVT